MKATMKSTNLARSAGSSTLSRNPSPAKDSRTLKNHILSSWEPPSGRCNQTVHSQSDGHSRDSSGRVQPDKWNVPADVDIITYFRLKLLINKTLFPSFNASVIESGNML